MLRVFVQGGGCSGMQYGFEFDEQHAGRGHLCGKSGRKAAGRPDERVSTWLGAEIDFREGLEGAQFVIRNPNATDTCGCGSSFSA